MIKTVITGLANPLLCKTIYQFYGKNVGKKFTAQGKHKEFYLGWNVATLRSSSSLHSPSEHMTLLVRYCLNCVTSRQEVLSFQILFSVLKTLF